MPRRDALGDAPTEDLVGQLAVAPVADRAVRARRLLAGQRHDLAHLLGAQPGVRLNGVDRDYRLDVSRFTRPFSLTGFPALALPSGVTADGLPTSVQLVAAPFDEARLLSLAADLQRQLAVPFLLSVGVR
jgi:hypothetical protein